MALEALPTELRILILQSIPNAATLHNLVLASRVYHETYLISRNRTLHEIAQRQFNLLGFIEPLTAVKSSGRYAEVELEKPGIIDLLHWRSTADEPTHIQSPERSIELLGLSRTFDVILQAFCAHAPCPHGTNPLVWERTLPLKPSETERSRILRALCRFQTYCNLFGARESLENSPAQPSPPMGMPSSPKRSSTWHRNFKINEMWNLMFATLPPWEVEEFGSVAALIRNEYTRIFAEMQPELSRVHPRWRELRASSHPVDLSDLYPSEDDDPSDFSIYINHLVSLGPGFLAKVLNQPTQEAQWRLVATNSVSGKSSFNDTAAVIREPSPQYALAAETSSQDGVSPELPSYPPLEQPSSGWKQHWYGHAVGDVVLTNQPGASDQSRGGQSRYFKGWEFGYALWDN